MTIMELDLEEALRTLFPHGHKQFVIQCLDDMAVHSAKNMEYAGGGDPLGNFRRVATILSQYPGLSLADPRVIAMVYLLKHLDAVLWQWSQHQGSKLDSRIERLTDIAVYTTILRIMERENGVG
jgi:hypothetical protein